MRSKLWFFISLLMLDVGMIIGYRLAPQPEQPVDATSPTKPLFYRHPMNPEITSPVAAKDEMGMDYIPVYPESAESVTDSAGTVKVDVGMLQTIGVRTAVAKRESLSHVIRTVGRIAYDEELLFRLHPKTEGWIEEVKVDKTGESVRKDADLLSIYSPQLVASQQEYLLALNNLKALETSPFADIRRGAEELLESSLERLKLLDVPAHQLHELTYGQKIHKSLHIHSPAEGIVINIGVREGQYVTPNTELYTIADLTRVWVYADIYEYELPWVKQGDRVEMRLAGVPGRIFKGHLAYVYPYAEAQTRTIKVRLAFANNDLSLKPEMYTDITIYADPRPDTLTIPTEAVIRSGARTQVFVVVAPGKFEPREVTLGLAADGKVEVISGLMQNETVVASAQFLIDSESKLREATAKMLPTNVPRKSHSTDHQHNKIMPAPTGTSHD